MINRRRAVQLSLVAAFLPSFLAQAFAADRTTELHAAWRRAVNRGCPLLVLVVPREQAWWFERGQDFGAVLNHGGDDALAPLALCEVVCGNAAELSVLLGQDVPADAVYALVETDGLPARVRFGELPPPEAPTHYDENWVREMDARTEVAIRAHRALLADLVMPDRATLERYAAQAEAADPDAVEQVRRSTGADGAPDAELAPSIVALMAADGEIDPLVAASALAEVARAAWVKHVVPGSLWAHAGGCGVDIEGDTMPIMRGCGMGFVSEKATRMLFFYEPEAR